MKKLILLFCGCLIFTCTHVPAQAQTLKKASQALFKRLEQNGRKPLQTQLEKAARRAEHTAQKALREQQRTAAVKAAREALMENPFSEAVPGQESLIRSVRVVPGGITEITLSDPRLWLPQNNDSRRAVDLLCRYKNWTRDRALAWIHQNPREASRRLGIPQFTGKAYLLEDFSAAVPPQNAWTYYPSYRLPQDMLRGMELRQTPADMTELLQKGLSVERAGTDKWTGKKLIFTTSSAQIALQYIWQKNRSVPVIVHMQNTPAVIHSLEHTVKDVAPADLPQIYETDQSIPPQNILRVSAFLCIDGACRWGSVTQTRSGRFLFRPYKLDRNEYVKKGAFLFLNRLFDND